MTTNEKPWTDVTISSWNKFDEQLDQLKPREWLFRGHSNSSWDLRTSLDRLFDDAQEIIRNAKYRDRTFAKRLHEELLIKAFQKNANLFLKFLPDNLKTLEWLAIMQHYGTPTRLLDVTLSPHVATFFALEAGLKESCVFAFNHAEIKKINKTLLKKETYKDMNADIFISSEPFVTAFDAEYGNERLVPQKGLFLVPSQVEQSFQNLLADYQQFGDSDICIKYNIPAKLRYSGLERLKQMNITSASLFPGIDGFSRSLKFQVLETIQSQRLLE
jgi:hypothetical protein